MVRLCWEPARRQRVQEGDIITSSQPTSTNPGLCHALTAAVLKPCGLPSLQQPVVSLATPGRNAGLLASVEPVALEWRPETIGACLNHIREE